MKREREPTAEEFKKLLAWLASGDWEYQTMHSRLTRIFVVKGCVDAEDLADEVLKRVAVRIDTVITKYEGNPIRCLRGFAERVYLEWREERERLVEIDPPKPIPLPDDEEKSAEQERKEREDNCLTQCMDELSPEERDLVRRYFQFEKRAKIDARRKLAEDLRLTSNALRIRAHRIGRRLRECLENCLEN